MVGKFKELPIEAVRGSGNAFRDLGLPNASLRHLKAVLAAEIVRALDDKELTPRKAQNVTGIAAADFSHIRRAKLARFTVDRLMTILNTMERDVDVAVTVWSSGKMPSHAVAV